MAPMRRPSGPGVRGWPHLRKPAVRAGQDVGGELVRCAGGLTRYRRTQAGDDDCQSDLPNGGHAELRGGDQRDYLV